MHPERADRDPVGPDPEGRAHRGTAAATTSPTDATVWTQTEPMLTHAARPALSCTPGAGTRVRGPMQAAEAPIWRFDKPGGDLLRGLLTSMGRARSPRREPEGRVCCAACAHTVTRPRARIDVQGSHQHRFLNPMGIPYEIACYGEAPGCFQLGEATEEHTWFPGYAWRVALCGSCQIHLGWGFGSREGGHFFALIVERLITRDEPGQ